MHNAVILTGMGAADALALEYDSLMSEVIRFAKTCSDEDWGTPCPNEQRTVGVIFDHIATGNPEVVRWIGEFLDGRPVKITPEILNARNAEHTRRVAARPRGETIDDLVSGSAGFCQRRGAVSRRPPHRSIRCHGFTELCA